MRWPRGKPRPSVRHMAGAAASGVGLGLTMAVAAGLVALNRAGHAIKEVVLEEYNRRMG